LNSVKPLKRDKAERELCHLLTRSGTRAVALAQRLLEGGARIGNVDILIGSFNPSGSRTAAVYSRACSIDREAGFVKTDISLLTQIAISRHPAWRAPLVKRPPVPRRFTTMVAASMSGDDLIVTCPGVELDHQALHAFWDDRSLDIRPGEPRDGFE
jgi:hypothetical protein